MKLNSEGKRVAFYTLGCKLNFAETSTIARDLDNYGFTRVNFSEPADLYVINTCSVTGNADSKCRKIIRQALNNSPDAFVTVMGCYAQLKPDEIARIPGVDLVLGTEEKFNITQHFDSLEKRKDCDIYSCEIEHINTFVPSHSLNERTRAFLKIQDGCDYSCSYCTVPLARGKSRSESISHILNTVREIATNGIKEIVLTGVNIGDFGSGRGENFFDLICSLDNLKGIPRFRISSIEPNLLSDDIICFVANSKNFVPHFHIPLQSGSNRILKLMRRRYDRELYIERISKVKSLIPDCCIGADIIVGFPDESEGDFLDTYNLVQELDLSYLHIFTYSERSNTPAYKMENIIPNSVKSIRSGTLHELSDSMRKKFYNSNLGEITEVLIETEKKGIIEGYSENYIRVKVPGPKIFHNHIIKVKLLANEQNYMRGEWVQ